MGDELQSSPCLRLCRAYTSLASAVCEPPEPRVLPPGFLGTPSLQTLLPFSSPSSQHGCLGCRGHGIPVSENSLDYFIFTIYFYIDYKLIVIKTIRKYFCYSHLFPMGVELKKRFPIHCLLWERL